MNDYRAMGAVIVGDEILSGKRRDRHLPHLIELLAARGLRLAWCRYEGDERAGLAAALRQTRAAGLPVLCFGGIGATPDDCTRQAAALAFERPLETHAEAPALIEQQFGEQAYPTRVRMAELPRASQLIPNPYNRIPGFTLARHHFFPGFPQMAWPMLEWVFERYYPHSYEAQSECSVQLPRAQESELCGLMEQLIERHPRARLFSLPHLGGENYIELGFRGPATATEPAFADLLAELERRQIAYRPIQPDPAG